MRLFPQLFLTLLVFSSHYLLFLDMNETKTNSNFFVYCIACVAWAGSLGQGGKSYTLFLFFLPGTIDDGEAGMGDDLHRWDRMSGRIELKEKNLTGSDVDFCCDFAIPKANPWFLDDPSPENGGAEKRCINPSAWPWAAKQKERILRCDSVN
ncbi:hypothetical protein HYFRA_00002103 [Hymenoscyphus fraxineus]|uniref:Uncharacterized protein n=1 Tax=Hymenoscyphus fraxineus TaxID=746836 RepID=A0A9N9KN14_9HELO|nr:hypothetical protein HYFRA_00002103 [Hymenoscyphus fraxineus]